MKHICENCLTIIYKSKVTPTVCPHCESGKMFDIGDSIADHILNLESTVDRLQQASRWIPVSERLPEVNTRVSLFDKKTGFSVYGSMQEWRDDRYLWKTDVGEYHFGSITHWQPLPTPPEGE